MAKKYKCPFCDRNYIEKDPLMDHMSEKHPEELHGLPPQQIYFNFTNKYALTKGFGTSVVSGKPTKFNLTTCKYERFADEADRQKYREMFKNRMMSTYGKTTLLNDPEQQKKMLENRSISGTHIWADGTKTTFTGTYERKFLEFMEYRMGWKNPNDIMAPAPMIFPYKDSEGKTHFHIPDFYITSLNLIVNIKSSENKHYRLRDIEMEKAQDAVIKLSKYNYIKIYDNEYPKFEKILQNMIDGKQETRVFLESVYQYETNNSILLD